MRVEFEADVNSKPLLSSLAGRRLAHPGEWPLVARSGGFEPPASGTGIQRSIQLSYERNIAIHAGLNRRVPWPAMRSMSPLWTRAEAPVHPSPTPALFDGDANSVGLCAEVRFAQLPL